VARSIGGTNLILWDPQGRPQAAIDVHVGSVRSHLESLLRRVLEGEDVRVESAGSGVALVGSVSNALAMERAVAVSETFLGEDSEERVVNLLSVEGNQQVMLKVIVAEMNRNLERELGTNFSSLIETDGKVIGITSLLENILSVADDGTLLAGDSATLLAAFSGFGSLSLLAVAMDVVERNGLGKILAEPTLVARSGEMASFLAGGEVPIPIAQGGAFGSITVEYKKFGVGVAFTPTVLGPDRIHLEVAPEVSEPDFNLGTEVDGIRVPGFVTRRASTSVELKDGQSFAIAGLLSDVVRSAAAKYPLLGDIPVLGALFRSTQYQKNETELVIIVTPQLVKPLGPPPHRLPTDSLVDPSALDFYLFGALEARGQAPPTSATRGEPTGAGGLIGDAGHRLPADPEEEVW
jgi:pilus assembly protein CpaC